MIANGVTLGMDEASLGNRLIVAGGTLRSTNSTHTAALDIRRGTTVFNAGLMEASSLRLTNALGHFEFNGGTLSTRAAAVTNGSPFTVGNGSDAAISFLEGAPTNIHAFADGLVLSSNATLTGNGTLDGQLTVTAGGTVAPGASVGHLNLTRPPALAGTLALEFSKSGGALTNDRIALSSGTLAYGGTLVVTDIGPEPLAAGDSVQLFLAPGYAGGFSSLTLPPLPAGLGWYNQLAANGTLTVVSAPTISSVVRAGTDLVLTVSNGIPGESWQLLTATNVALPLSGWTTNSSGFADPSGNVILTNPLILTEPRRFFRLQQP